MINKDISLYVDFFQKNIGEVVLLLTEKSKKVVRIIDVNNNFVLFKTSTYRESHSIYEFLCGEAKCQPLSNNLDILNYTTNSVEEEIVMIKNNILTNIFETVVYKKNIKIRCKNKIIQNAIVAETKRYYQVFEPDDLFNEAFIIFQDVLLKHNIKNISLSDTINTWKRIQSFFCGETDDNGLQEYLNQFYSHFRKVLYKRLWWFS